MSHELFCRCVRSVLNLNSNQMTSVIPLAFTGLTQLTYVATAPVFVRFECTNVCLALLRLFLYSQRQGS